MNTKTMKPSEILIAARELLSVPERWTTEVMARDADGLPVHVKSDDASCFCSLGAIVRAAGYYTLNEPVVDFLRDAMGTEIGEFNDANTYAEVIDAFDRAIIAAKEEGK